MSFPWRPLPDKPGHYTCTEHGGEWTRGRVCPRCAVGSVQYARETSEAETIQAQARELGLPTVLDHEQWYLGLASNAERIAADLQKQPKKPKGKAKRGRPEKPPLLAIAKFLEIALKARGRAAALTEWRDDWARTERLRREAQRGGGRGRAGMVFADPGGGAN